MTEPSAPRLEAPARGARSIADLWFDKRNRILADPRFQRWAAWFPPFRFIARRRTAALFDMCAGFVYSQILYASVKVGLLETLAQGPQTIEELSPKLSLPAAATRRLLDAAASLELVERRGADRYGLGIHGAAFMGNPAVAAMVRHHALLYRDLADPLALLRGERHTTELSQFWSYAGERARPPADADVAPYSELMAASLGLIADDILEAYPHGRHRRLLDVGGGEGAFLEAAAARAPDLSLVLFDLPPVAARAAERLARAGLASRTTVVGGDVFRDPLPTGADLVSLVRVIHDHDDEAALAILHAVRRAMRTGDVLLVAEPMAGTTGAEPMGDAYFGFYLLAMGQGRPRTFGDLRALLQRAGFHRIRHRNTRRPMLSRLVIAEAE